MNRKKRKRLLLSFTTTVVVLAVIGYWLFFLTFSSRHGHYYVYIDADDTRDSVYMKLDAAAAPPQMLGVKISATLLGYEVRAGRYDVSGVGSLTLVRNLRNGHQAPVRLTIPNVRTADDLATRLAAELSPSKSDFIAAFRDTTLLRQFDVDTTTLPCLFIPNTYEVFWNITPKQLLERMKKESDTYWTVERKVQAKAAGLTPQEVVTLASIVDQETANNEEKPMVAGMYLNRLHQGMKLQADPTVKFALHRPDLRRILHEHLTVDSPYNTYRYAGLPPGPICFPALSSIEAVLHYTHHDYLYMCAKEDFSGTHNFAVTYEEHLQNAEKYAQALNARGIH